MSNTSDLTWTKEAQENINQVPFFVRGKVKKKVEDFAREKGYSEITPQVLDEVKDKTGNKHE